MSAPQARAYITCGALIAVASGASGCRGWVTERAVPEQAVAVGERGPLRVTRADGSVVVLMHPVVANDSITGTTQSVPPQRVAIPIIDVTSVERRTLSPSRSVEAVKVYGLVIASIAAVFEAIYLIH